jgi:hypothetical protein
VKRFLRIEIEEIKMEIKIEIKIEIKMEIKMEIKIALAILRKDLIRISIGMRAV